VHKLTSPKSYLTCT